MKIKISYIVYVLIATIFAGYSILTDIKETIHYQAIYSHLGLMIGLLIAASVLIGITKSLIKELTD